MTTNVTIISVFGHRNKGDAAIFASLVSHVEALVPDVAIAAVVRQPETENPLYPMLRIEEQLLRSISRFRPVKLLQMLWFSLVSLLWVEGGGRVGILLPKRKQRTLEAIAQADLVLSCGGGFLHDSFPGFVVHLFEMYVAKRLGRPVVLVGQSVGPFRSAWSRWLARSVLSRCDVILPRERISERYLSEELGVSGPKVTLIPDLAFTLVGHAGEGPRPLEASKARLAGGRDVLGVTVRFWNFPGQPGRVTTRNADFQRKLSAVLDGLIESTGLKVVFFPQAITAGFLSFDDRMVSRKVAAMMQHGGEVTLIEDDLSVAELRRMIGECKLFVGTRMHSNIFALTAGVPTLGIAYLPKTQGIMDLTGVGHLVVGIEASVEELHRAAQRLVDEQEDIRDRLQERIPELQDWIRTTLAKVFSEMLTSQSSEDEACR